MESRGGIILTGETEAFGEKPVPQPLCRPQILHGLTWERTKASEIQELLTVKQAVHIFPSGF
jgi:hypothetical protein